MKAARGHDIQCGVLFCYRERLLKGWKSSLSSPQPLWQTFPSSSPCPVLVILCCVPLKSDRAIRLPTERSSREHLLDLLKGSKTQRMDHMAGKSIPQKTWLSPDHTEWLQHGTRTAAVYPQGWGKDISQGPEVTEENWADSATWLSEWNSLDVKTHLQGQRELELKEWVI